MQNYGEREREKHKKLGLGIATFLLKLENGFVVAAKQTKSLRDGNLEDLLEMEEKRREPGTLASAAGSSGDSPASEPTTRRRGGALKRKANALGGSSNSSSTPSKRMLTREKAMLASFSPVHNGPLTRARQAPSNIPSASGDKSSEVLNVADGEKPKEEEERNKAIREWEVLEAKIEADFEAIRSRDSDAHVVPNHCGLFYFFLCLVETKPNFSICFTFVTLLLCQILILYMETFQSRRI